MERYKIVTELDWKNGETCGLVETFTRLGQKIIATFWCNVISIWCIHDYSSNKISFELVSYTIQFNSNLYRLSRKENNCKRPTLLWVCGPYDVTFPTWSPPILIINAICRIEVNLDICGFLDTNMWPEF